MATAVQPQLIRDPRTDEVAKWFAEHRATFAFLPPVDSAGWPIQTLIWAKPDSGHFALRYVIMGPVLLVWGDLECAVYRWSQAVTWKFLAGCDLQYFHGKCEASPRGKDFEDYDRDLALADFNAALLQRAEDGYKHPDPRAVDDGRKAIQYGQDEWRDWMRDEGYRVFGDDRYEWLPGLGKRTAQTCLAHLLGIKLAVAQTLKKEAE